MKRPSRKLLIGRSDVAHFPKLGLVGIAIKIDTGAYTSSMHCHRIAERDGKLYCRFLDPKHAAYHEREIMFEAYQRKVVRSSNGQEEERYLIKTQVRLFGKRYRIQLSLTERGSMRFPVLLGRKFLGPKFIVDTARVNLSHENQVIKIKLPE